MKRKSRGFTLIELLVAITVLAIVAVLGWRGLDSIVRARVALNSDLEYTRGLQLAFAQMQSDADHIVTSDNIGGRAPLAAQKDRLMLVRTVFMENQPSQVQVVVYRVRDGVLTRQESLASRNLQDIDTAWAAASSDADIGSPVVLHPGVQQMTTRIWQERIGWRIAGAPPPPAPGNPAIPRPRDTGLEVTLQPVDQPSGLVKVFLLGAV